MKTYLNWFIPQALLITLFCGMMYVVVQQVYRQSANDPQIEMARFYADKLSQGTAPSSLANQDLDIATTLSPFIIIYDATGKAVTGTAKLNGTLPELPAGVLQYTTTHGEDRITWQPQAGVRAAIDVVSYTDNGTSGFILVGKSLKETEAREQNLMYQVLMGWIGTIALVGGCGFMFRTSSPLQNKLVG